MGNKNKDIPGKYGLRVWNIKGKELQTLWFVYEKYRDQALIDYAATNRVKACFRVDR